MDFLFVSLLAVTVYGGYVFPLMGLTMSWREWFKVESRGYNNSSNWRRITTILSLYLFTASIPLWSYGVARELGRGYSYISLSARIGRWSSLALFAVSLFAEGKVRRYLLIGAAGLLFFFAMTIGELP